MTQFAHDHFEALIGLLMVAVAVRLGFAADWSVTTEQTLIATACLLGALLVVGVWHRATRRKH
ncbi:MAG: hypothetical protein AB7G23_20940 [Vicinamibacterales bacterium]